jgi:lipoprotein-anchoring transpeptidase ErfK/SrfK
VITAAAALVGAAPGSADLPSVAWQAPSPAAGSVLSVQAGQKFKITLNVAAAAVSGASITVKAAHLPHGATLKARPGNPASAVFSWRPSGPQIGDRGINFTAAIKAAVPLSVPPLGITIRVVPRYSALSASNFSHWAFMSRPAIVRSTPSLGARPVGHISLWTAENYPNLVTMLEQRVLKSGTWVHVRFAKLPNNTTGWIKRGALGRYHALNTHIVVDRAATRLTLYKNGAVIFQTRVGVGQHQWPTPRGEFYVTEKLTGFHDAAYGPLAFGTSARSAVLTDWPGGGFIGIHGTNAPGLIPGHISHGCVRVRNAAVLQLGRIVPVGTPLTIQ